MFSSSFIRSLATISYKVDTINSTMSSLVLVGLVERLDMATMIKAHTASRERRLSEAHTEDNPLIQPILRIRMRTARKPRLSHTRVDQTTGSTIRLGRRRHSSTLEVLRHSRRSDMAHRQVRKCTEVLLRLISSLTTDSMMQMPTLARNTNSIILVRRRVDPMELGEFTLRLFITQSR